MPEDYYNDSPPADQTEMPASKETPEKMDEEHDEKTALIPASLCPGMEFNPGDEIVLKVVSVHEDELEVEYAPEKGKDEDKESESPSMAKASASNADSSGGGSGMSQYME